MTAYLAAQTLLFVLFSMLFMAAHRRLLAGPGYRRWLEGVGATNGQWLLAFPIAACVCAVPAGILFSKADKPIGALLPAAIGVVLCLVAKNLAYAFDSAQTSYSGMGRCGFRVDDRLHWFVAARWRRDRPVGLAAVVRRQRSACCSRDRNEHPGIQDFAAGPIDSAVGDEAQAACETPTLTNPFALADPGGADGPADDETQDSGLAPRRKAVLDSDSSGLLHGLRPAGIAMASTPLVAQTSRLSISLHPIQGQRRSQTMKSKNSVRALPDRSLATGSVSNSASAPCLAGGLARPVCGRMSGGAGDYLPARAGSRRSGAYRLLGAAVADA